MTPLHLAAERARVKVVNYLADKEADIINIQDWDGVNNVVCDGTDDECLFDFGLASFHGT